MDNQIIMDRPFLTFEQQISRLRDDYSLIIENDFFAIEALTSVSYYDLVNGYKSIYMINNKYEDGVSIEMLFSTHLYNKNIQGVLMKYSTYVENSFKTILSHVVAKNFSEHQDSYLKIDNYKRHRNNFHRNKLEELLLKLQKLCTECDDNPTKHYRNTKNHTPPWILFRNASFSDITDLFKSLKHNGKVEVINHMTIFSNFVMDYEKKISVMISALNMVRKYRNKIAHNLDFISYKGSELNGSAFEMFRDTLVNTNEQNRSTKDVWCCVLSIVILLNNRYLIHNFLTELNTYLNTGTGVNEIYCKHAGIPQDYEERIIKYVNALKI